MFFFPCPSPSTSILSQGSYWFQSPSSLAYAGSTLFPLLFLQNRSSPEGCAQKPTQSPSSLPTLVCASELQKRRGSVNSIIPMEIGGNCRLPQILCRLLGICERTPHVPRMFAVPFQQPCPLHSTVPLQAIKPEIWHYNDTDSEREPGDSQYSEKIPAVNSSCSHQHVTHSECTGQHC